MIQITEQAANAVLRLLEDVRDADERARCSDAYFRSHFLTIARLPDVAGAANEIKAALEAPPEITTTTTARVSRTKKTKTDG